MAGRRSRLGSPAIAALLVSGCLVPNPNAGVDETSDGEVGEASSADTTEDTGPVCEDPCGLQFASMEFDAGSDGFSGSVPKPDLPNAAAFALVREYSSGGSETLGYAITWTDVGDAFEFTVALTGASPNSRVAGLAVVLGAAEPPIVEQVDVTAADGCGETSIDSLAGRAFVDTVERYEPAEDPVLNFAREVTPNGSGATVEYCISDGGTDTGSLGYKVVSFELPIGVTALDAPNLTLDSGGSQSANFPRLGNGSVSHFVGVKSFDEMSAPDLGYTIECDAAAPYSCSYDLLDFKGGVSATVGGLIVEVQ